jgi:myo-inositol-1(or 4)-monophosphatase
MKSDFIKEKITQAGDIALDFYQQEFYTKTKSHKNDLITEADKSVSKYLVDEINDKFSDHKIISEELDEQINPNSNKEWVIDPIDGTFNFVKGMHIWAVMIAYLEDGKTKMSSIYFPVVDELYFANKNGSFLNGTEVSVSSTNKLKRSSGKIFCAPDTKRGGEYIKKYKKAASNMILNSGVEFVNFGSSAPASCYLAKGSIDFMIVNIGEDWDYLPTLFMAQKAGARVTTSSGEEWKRGGSDVIVANPNLHSKILEFF